MGFGASPANPDASTITEHARWLAQRIECAYAGWPVGLVGHSLASCIAVEAADLLNRCAGIFSIEGNLTAADAYFSGKAAEHDAARSFKSAMLDAIWQRATTTPILRRYHAALTIADAEAMWRLGRDAKRITIADDPGQALKSATVPKLYYWSRANTPDSSIACLAGGHVPEEHFHDASHWPPVDAPEATAAALARFFDPLLTGSDFPTLHAKGAS